MSWLSKMEAKLPPGFRFHPRDEELISDYLAGKASGDRSGFPAMMMDVDFHKCEPWALPETACVGGKEWFFYSLPDRKYASGLRTNRATLSGYWKATGKDRPVVDPRRRGLVGRRKTLVFYHGRTPKGRKTNWVMHEFRLFEGPAASTTATSTFSSSSKDWVLCRVFYRSRGHPPEASTGSSHDEAGPSSLPPLVDTLGLGQAQLILEDCQQTPCSSCQPPGQQPQWRGSLAATHISVSAEASMAPEVMAESFAPPWEMLDCGSHLNSMFYEKNAILDHLHTLDGNPRIEGSSHRHLSESGAQNMGNHPL